MIYHYVCEICKKQYKTEPDALACEKHHYRAECEECHTQFPYCEDDVRIFDGAVFITCRICGVIIYPNSLEEVISWK